MTTNIWYGTSEAGWKGYENFLMEMIVQTNAKYVLDVGGGANPLLNNDFIQKNAIDYSILDISEAELQKAPEGYNKILADAASKHLCLNKQFDFVFSKVFLEHIKDPEQFHRNIYNLLSNNGISVHFFPTLYALPFVVNKLLPETISEILLDIFSPRDRHRHEKFPAYYHWCRGPIKTQCEQFRKIGFEVIEYAGFFGHSDYYKKLNYLRNVHEMKTAYLLKNPNPLFTSYAHVVLKKSSR